ncbi:MAG: GNAT family N-acetyltransferase [Acidimicrobiia bacterium]
MDRLEFSVAGPDDWPDIWPVFAAVVATGDTYPYLPDTPEERARAIWMAPSHTVLVASIGDEVVATAYYRPNMAGLGDHVANAGWMVHPDRQGQGIGRRFAAYVLDHARDAGFGAMQFNAVVATNTRAIALWESLGFEIVGTVPDAFRHPAHGLTPVHVMYRSL